MYLRPLGKSTVSNSIVHKGAKVVYSQGGGGETVLLLHGFLEERSMWKGLTNVLRQHYQVITVDLLGQGESESIGYVHSMADQAEAVYAVLQQEGIDNCLVVGHSMGGYIALELARLQPELISGLVLFHSTAYEDSPARKKDRERMIALVKRNKGVLIRSVIPSLFSDKTRKGLTAEIEALVNTANGFSVQGIVANVRGMMERSNREDVLKSASFEKLLIHGEFDTVISEEDITAQAQLNNNIELAVVENVGHMGHLEAPEKCQSLIIEFCNRIWKN